MDHLFTGVSGSNFSWRMAHFFLDIRKLDPYSGTTLFLFCNKRHTVIKALRWDGNGFLLATKQLANDMKFQWPKTQGELRDINIRQMQWLLEGLQIDQKKAHPQTVDTTSTVF